VARLAEDRFRIFVSHKHEDHALAVAVQQALEGISPKIECFVSGVSIAAGADWNREIKSSLAQSHLLILLFTRPTASWDWCLFETGLFARSDVDDISAVICLFDPQESSPSPLTNLQGVPAQRDAVERFLGDLCRATWRVSDDWRLGALVPRVRENQLARAAAKIVHAFPERAATDVSHYPCHRVVLDLRHLDAVDGGIPDEARVVVGPGATTDFTLALFNLAEASTEVTWGQLIDAVDGRTAVWRMQLDRRFAAALNKALFTPITGTFRAWSQGRRQQRVLKPILYRIVWTADGIPGTGRVGRRGRPAEVTLLLDSLPMPTRVGGSEMHLVRINARFQTEVFDEFAGTVHARAREGIAVLDDIREALELVYDEANAYGIFEVGELRRVYGEDYDRLGLDEMGHRWLTTLQDLQAAIDERDLDGVEARLGELRRLNRTFSRLSTERLLHTFDADG
jgi:hypothetical protein